MLFGVTSSHPHESRNTEEPWLCRIVTSGAPDADVQLMFSSMQWWLLLGVGGVSWLPAPEFSVSAGPAHQHVAIQPA